MYIQYETHPSHLQHAEQMRQNLSLGFPTKRDSSQSPQQQRLARKSIYFCY